MKTKFKVGDYVRVRGYNNRAYINHIHNDRTDAVTLDRQVAGFAMWNFDDLVKLPKPKKKRYTSFL